MDALEWVEATPVEVAEMLGVSGPDEDLIQDALALLCTDPESRDFIRGEEPSQRPAQDLEYRLRRTRLFVNVERLKDVRGDALAALAVWLMSHSPTWTAAVAALRKASSAIRIMSNDEVRLYETVLQETNRTTRSVSTGRLVKVSGVRRRELEALLELMETRGVLERDRDGWRVPT